MWVILFFSLVTVLLICVWILLKEPPKGERCLKGKTAIVTGGNRGIGYHVCLNLARRGCRVIIADRDDSTESRERIIRESQNPNIVSKTINLASFKSVREFAKDIKATEERLDILVNNAGIATLFDEISEDGYNILIQVNHLGPFLLTHLLLDLLKKSAPSRIINTSSVLAFLGRPQQKAFEKSYVYRPSAYHIGEPYSDSKLFVLLASDTFAEKLKGSGVTSNALHPGYIKTDLLERDIKHLSRYRKTANLYCFLNNIFATNVAGGATTTTYLATSEAMEGVAGKYFWRCRSMVKPISAYNTRIKEKIWRKSEECTKLEAHEKI